MRLSTWVNLLSPTHDALRAAASLADPRDAAAVARLRKLGDADTVAAAISLARARTAAEAKFGSRAATLVADHEGVQQASSLAVAAHKARRLRDTLGSGARVADLCCGIGGDAIAMSAAGLRVIGVDLDPVRVWMTSQNARCPVACADVTAAQVKQLDAFHLDPARRSDGRRIFGLDDYQPGPLAIRLLLSRCPHACVKLGPGVNLADVAASQLRGELEFVSENGRLVQALLWTGRLEQNARRATVLVGGGHTPPQAVSLAGDPEFPPTGPLRRYLYAVDPSVERAELLHVLCERVGAPMIHMSLGLLTSDARLASPWLTPFELLAEMPWRPAKVKAWLGEHGAGVVEVKTRGKAVDPDVAQRELRGRGDERFAVFVLRWDERKVALITRRV